MCLPAAALPVAALVTSAIAATGSVVAGMQANSMGKYRQKIAEQNAALDREAITVEKENTQRTLTNHWRRVAEMKGQQRLAAAAGGVSTDFGSAAQLVEDTDMLAREDADMIAKQGVQNVRGLDRSVSNSISEGRAARSQGKGALVGSFFDAGSTMLGGSTQYGKLKAGL